MLKIAIIGNREGWKKENVFKILDEHCLIGNSINIITGGAKGIDTYAMEYAKKKGCVLTVYYPDFLNYPIPYVYRKRNEKIAWECDTLIAFDKKEFSGTLQTINFARKFNKAVIIITGE